MGTRETERGCSLSFGSVPMRFGTYTQNPGPRQPNPYQPIDFRTWLSTQDACSSAIGVLFHLRVVHQHETTKYVLCLCPFGRSGRSILVRSLKQEKGIERSNAFFILFLGNCLSRAALNPFALHSQIYTTTNRPGK